MTYSPTGITAPGSRIKFTALGALYGFLIGTVFLLVAAYIDLWLYPDLPLGTDWDIFTLRFPFIALGLALTGALTCWWNEAWQGLLSGSLFLAALALAVALFTSEIAAEAKFVVLLFILMPMAVISLPAIWTLQRLARSHASALGMQWGYVRIAGLLVIATALGAGAGYFMKMSSRAVESNRLLHGYLQDISSDDNPLHNAQGAREHAAVPYTLYTTRSTSSTEGFEIRVEYEDGFSLQCIVVAYPGYKPYLSACEAGE